MSISLLLSKVRFVRSHHRLRELQGKLRIALEVEICTRTFRLVLRQTPLQALFYKPMETCKFKLLLVIDQQAPGHFL